jgi:hypothetical protein
VSSTIKSTSDSLVASTQVNDLFDDSDSEVARTFVSPCEVNFTDVRGHSAEDEVLMAARYCLVDGYSTARFYPDNFIRREELAKITVNMMLLKLEGFVRQFEGIDYAPFVDVPASNQLAPYMSYVSRLGVWEDLFVDSNRRQFDPQGFVSAQDMISLLGVIARLYPNYMGNAQINVDFSKTWLTRAEVVSLMMSFFWDDTTPTFQSETI